MLHEIAPKKYHVEYQNLTAVPEDRVIVLASHELVIRDTEALSFPTVEECGLTGDPGDLRYLFAIDETRYFALLDEEKAAALSARIAAGDCTPGSNAMKSDDPGNSGSARFRAVPERSVRNALPREEAYAAALGCQFTGWYRRSVFCGRCGEKTVHAENERMMRCPKCGNMIYPQICPSVIVGVFHEGKILVTRYNPAHREVSNGHLFKAPVHEALVAGYIETGETAEEAVQREVMEEVGLKVKNIRFYKDTPWPFSGSLLFAFLCDVDGDPTLSIEEDELSSAVFKSREELPDRSKDVSLTSSIMEDFRLGRI